MTSPWTNQAISLIVLTEQTAGFSGLFGYSPTVGAGSLIFSLSAAAGTDPYGNSYPQGVSSTVGQVAADAITTDTLTLDQGPLLLYGNPNQTTTTFTAGQSGNWTAPAGVTSVTAFGLAGGGPGSIVASPGGNGGGGGESFTQTFTVVPGHQYAYSVGNAAQNTTFNGITANAGGAASASAVGAGGTGSTAATHYAGGPGGLGGTVIFFTEPGGGGSSAGSMQAGNAGSVGSGGAAPAGGGAGGDPGSAGSVPGGGGGGNTSGSPLAGGGGQLVLTYTAVAATNLLASIASTAGSDSLGNSWGSGLTVDGNAVVTVALTVNGTDVGATLASIISALSGAATSTDDLTDDSITGTSDEPSVTGFVVQTSGVQGQTVSGSSVAQHTHSYGHEHGPGSFAVGDGQHAHTLPTV